MTEVQHRWLGSVDTSLGQNVLLLEALRGTEALSALFDFRLRLRSEKLDIDPKALLGSQMTVRLQRPGSRVRFLHGLVTRFGHLGADARNAWYEARLQPRMCLMAEGRDRKIFQDMTVPEILRKVLDQHAIRVTPKLRDTNYPRREYCVQFDESPLDFVSRLMEEEGIFYFFDFSESGHTLILADSPAAHRECAGASELVYAPQGPDKPGLFDLALSAEVEGPAPVLADYDYLNATVLHTDGAKAQGGRLYCYPGRYTQEGEGKRKADILAAALQLRRESGSARSESPALCAGAKFRLRGHPDSRYDQSYILKTVAHDFRQGEYHNQVDIFPESLPFRSLPLTARPKVAGTHTGVVVGPSGEEIWTDDHGRIKVRFHWDDGPETNQDASCWMRVTQPLAGQGWGAWFLPRVGQEVLVAYADGDPDQPLVVGTLYNVKQTLPLQLPDQQTQTVLRSRSTPSGQAGNELRMEDRAGEEQFYLRAQKDMKVEAQAQLFTQVGEGETHSIEKGDRVIRVADGNERHEVQGKREINVTGDETHLNGARFSREVAGDYVLTVSGNLTLDVRGMLTIKTIGGYSLESSSTVSVKGLSIEQKASATQTLDGGGLLLVKGGLVKMN
ncbi:type VI secretion system Vgr family protein [Bordetella avium]|uniref:type VI secretion system Vgr family protein n=1 Tax=Bordetella avium TaxID=521 RepID=UPI0039FCF730